MSVDERADRPLLEATDLVAGYHDGRDVLSGCSLTVDRGELVGVIGPNGAGKSTLLGALCGLVPLRTGSVRLEGIEVGDQPPHVRARLGLGIVPQAANVFPNLTVAEHLRMGAITTRRELAQRLDAVHAMLPRLAELPSRRVGLLSGGQQRLVAIARALMGAPKVLLVDEPGAGLAPGAQAEVFEHLSALVEAGVAVLLVEQDTTRCLDLCERAYVLDRGRVVFSGSGHDLAADERLVDLYLVPLGAPNDPR